MNTTVKDVMTTHVVAVRLKASYKDMASRLREFRVSAFPVLDDDNRVVGVVSEADLLTKEALEYSTAGVAASALPSLFAPTSAAFSKEMMVLIRSGDTPRSTASCT